jgi:BlaI family penicillinase repressor
MYGVNISEAEWQIMKILWKEGRLTAAEIIDRAKDTGWSESTVKTLIRRLNEKNIIGKDSSGAKFSYYPLVSEASVKKKETKSFLDRIYNGSLKMLVASLAPKDALTEDEADELMKIIEKIEGGK